MEKEQFLNRLSITKTTALIVVILCFTISAAWGAKPGSVLYVNAAAGDYGDGQSWITAFNDLQDAIDAALPGDEIWVTAGTYKPSKKIVDDADPCNATFILKSGVKIYGGFAGDENQVFKRQIDPSLTVLSGDIGTIGDDTDNSYHVVYADGVTDAVLDGFTVTGGRGKRLLSSWDREDSNKGAGMYNKNSSLTVANCTFSDNQVATISTSSFFDIAGYGAGMYNDHSAPIVSNCTFTNNKAGGLDIVPYPRCAYGLGGGMYNEGYFGTTEEVQWPVITDCTFSDNEAGGRLPPYILNFWETGGGGMYNHDCYVTVDSCTFVRNSATQGGAMLNDYGAPKITNSIFSANFTTALYDYGFGGAIFNIGDYALIMNCTFYQNGGLHYPDMITTQTGGAIYLYYSHSIIANSVFMENGVIGSGGVTGSGGAIVNAGPNPNSRPSLYNNLFYNNISWDGWYTPTYVVIDHVSGSFYQYPVTFDPDSLKSLYDIDPLLADPAGGDFHLRYDSPAIDAGTTRTFAKYLLSGYGKEMPSYDFYGNTRVVDADGDDVVALDIGVHEFIPNLPDLRAYFQDLADSDELDGVTAARLLAYADAALAESDLEAVTTILNELINDVEASLDDIEMAQLIVGKTMAVIESLD